MPQNDSLSFSEAYGLSLIAKNPQRDWSIVITNLGDDAKQIAKEMIAPGSARGDVKSAAKELLRLAEELRQNHY